MLATNWEKQVLQWEVLVALSELYLVSCEFLLGIKPNEKCNSIENEFSM